MQFQIGDYIKTPAFFGEAAGHGRVIDIGTRWVKIQWAPNGLDFIYDNKPYMDIVHLINTGWWTF